MDEDERASPSASRCRSGKRDTEPSRLSIKRMRFSPDTPDGCDFCTNDPRGRAAASIRPCDTITITRELIVECSNCANHRLSTSSPHACIVPAQGRIAYRRYADGHPISYFPAHCDGCAPHASKSGSCDVDVLLGYSCSECKRDCQVNGIALEKRPNVPSSEKPWFRHGCSTCHAMNQGKTSVVQGCSWLYNRLSWDLACDQCDAMPALCLDRGIAVSDPLVQPPQTWSLSRQDTRGLINLTNAGPWRFPCRWCVLQNEKCRASTLAPANACNRCSVHGIDCIGRDGELYPIFDLSHVGYGRIMAMDACARCVAMRRNCDRQRPCDSCVNHDQGADCEASSNGCYGKGRFDHPPGPLYYLGLGYGALGVDDVKDGSHIEHWIGPPWPAYVMHGQDQRRAQSITTRMELVRAAFLPEGKPPHGGHGGSLTSLQPSKTTVEQLVNAIRDQWPNVKPPREYYRDFEERLAEAKSRLLARGNHRTPASRRSEASTTHLTPTRIEDSPMASRQQAPALQGDNRTLNEILDDIEAQFGIDLNEIGHGLPPFTEAYEGEARFLALVRDDEPFVFDDGPVVPAAAQEHGNSLSYHIEHVSPPGRDDAGKGAAAVGETQGKESSGGDLSTSVQTHQPSAALAPGPSTLTAQHNPDDEIIWTVPENATAFPGVLIPVPRSQQRYRARATGPIDTSGDPRSLGLMTQGQYYSTSHVVVPVQVWQANSYQDHTYHNSGQFEAPSYDDEDAQRVAEMFMKGSFDQLADTEKKA